jgi:hypothetical protein
VRWTLQERAQWIPRRLRVDGVVRLAPHVATLALVWADVRRRAGLGRYLDDRSTCTRVS